MRPPSPPPDSGWSSIRPFTPRLLLTVWEITPVSVTLILTTSLDTTYIKRPSTADEPNDTKHGISEILESGLAVKVNADPWDKVVIHTGEDEEEAIVTICGLMPSVNYVIDLHVAAADEDFHGAITTASNIFSNDLDPALAAQELEPEAIVTHVPFQTATPESTPPSSPARRSPSPPPASTSSSSIGLMTVEERVAQLRNTLAATIAERDAAAAQLRVARRESQRVDSAVRSEIEALKRVSEKNAQTELRTKRKIASAQKVVEQLNLASEEAENQLAAVLEALPELEAKEATIWEEHARVKEEAERSALEADDALKSDKKRAMDLEAEDVDLDTKLETVKERQSKLTDDTIPELERQLAALNKEIEIVEQGSAVHLPIEFNHETDYPHHYHQNPPLHPFPQQGFNGRNQPLPPGRTMNRPAPIQRPSLPGPGNSMSPTSNPNLNAFSSSQRSLEDATARAGGGGGPIFYPHNTNTGAFPQIRHPSVSAHPAPRGLFSSGNSGVQRPMNGPVNRRPGPHPSSSSSLSLRNGLGGNDPFVTPGSGMHGSGAAPGYPMQPQHFNAPAGPAPLNGTSNPSISTAPGPQNR